MFGTAVITLFAAVLAGFASASPITRPETTTCRFTGCPTYELSPRMYMLGGSEIIASPAIECHYGYHASQPVEHAAPSDQSPITSPDPDAWNGDMIIVGTCTYDSSTGEVLNAASALIDCAPAQVQCYGPGRDW